MKIKPEENSERHKKGLTDAQIECDVIFYVKAKTCTHLIKSVPKSQYLNDQQCTHNVERQRHRERKRAFV